MIAVQLLIALTLADLVMMILLDYNNIETIYGVQYVSTGVKLLTFVSFANNFLFN
jgi:hypothetical protein